MSREITWILDCDNTLYPQGSGFFQRINLRIISYMHEVMGLEAERIEPLRRSWRESYGVTLGGLIAHHNVEPEHYLSYVHDVEIDDIIHPDPALARALEELEGEKVVFTNGSQTHADRVLNRLGVRASISRIFDIAFTDYKPKPQLHGYMKLLDALGADPRSCVMADDLVVNLDTAKALGMTTVYVGEKPVEGHFYVETAQRIGEVLDP